MINKPTKPKKNSQRGQSLVELALSLMVILMLLMGAIDFGVALFAYVSMRDAAQEGAVYGSIEPTDTDGIIARTMAAADDIIIIEEADITISYSDSTKLCEGSTNVSGVDIPHKITVSIVHQHPVSTPLVGAMIGSQTITLRTQVTNTILSPVCDP
ncbi:MAG: pilus assembly protein [Chloroflexi bacterium]|nr:pilus assembly protein [Chloroflexota bacterium]